MNEKMAGWWTGGSVSPAPPPAPTPTDVSSLGPEVLSLFFHLMTRVYQSQDPALKQDWKRPFLPVYIKKLFA